MNYAIGTGLIVFGLIVARKIYIWSNARKRCVICQDYYTEVYPCAMSEIHNEDRYKKHCCFVCLQSYLWHQRGEVKGAVLADTSPDCFDRCGAKITFAR